MLNLFTDFPNPIKTNTRVNDSIHNNKRYFHKGNVFKVITEYNTLVIK